MLRRVPLRGWLLLILCFAACGAVFSFTYLQHLESIAEDHGFHRFQRARSWARRRQRHGSGSSGGNTELVLHPASQHANGSRLSANAADWLHERNARNAAAAAAGAPQGDATGSNSSSDGDAAAEQVKLAAGGFHKRQRRRVDEAAQARPAQHRQRGAGAASDGQQRQRGAADTGRSGGGDGSRGHDGSGGGVSTDAATMAGRVDGDGTSDGGADSSRGRPQGRRGDPARCGRGIPHGQDNRFCCSGAGFVCGGGGNAAVDGNLGSSTEADSGGGGGGNGEQIDCARVNDNYADCPDGSDEPGTSAASHLGAHFTCHDGNTIPASFVDDGICDCCDGADERPPTPRCRNRCAAQVDKELEYI